MIPVVWLNYEPDVIARGYWDQGMVEDMLANKMWETGYKFRHYEGWPEDRLRGAIVVFPARNQTQFTKRLNSDLAKLDWVILILTGDEESAFPVENIKHDNMEVWVMSPRTERHAKYTPLGTGYAIHFRGLLPDHAPEKDVDWFFAGQITHDRRQLLAQKAEQIKIHTKLKGVFHASPGFTQGLPPKEYAEYMSRAKVAPAPSGPETTDSFRIFEALEAGAIPIADGQTPKNDWPDNYWTWFFDSETPFPVLRHYDHLQGYIEDMVAEYPVRNNQVFIWWQHYKRKLALRLSSQIAKLSGEEPIKDDVTILMPSSPAGLHPSTEHIEQTIRDVRVQLPNSPIILMLDGVRPEQEDRRADYEEYQRRVLWLCNKAWDNVIPLRFEEFGHQSTMTRAALEMVDTPYVLFVEHDTPLVPDFSIPWPQLKAAIASGSANVIRLHHESLIHPEHEHLMLSGVEDICGAPMRKTSQWSQRPHLVSTIFYKHLMETHFRPEAKAFIEHGLYGPLVESCKIDGMFGWNLWRVWIYTPPGDNIQRSYDLNSRGGDPNYDSLF